MNEYPQVIGYGDHIHLLESFEQYYEKWPKTSAVPKDVVEQWIYRHWSDFEENWVTLNPHCWEFELQSFDNDKLLKIDHIGDWIQQLDAEGKEYVEGKPRSETWLGQHMLSEGTFPVPIIVAEHCGHIRDPRGWDDDYFKEPYQLIEGHCRLACIRGMINSSHKNLKKEHQVWVIKIPNQQK